MILTSVYFLPLYFLSSNPSQNHSTHCYGLLKVNNKLKVTAVGLLLYNKLLQQVKLNHCGLGAVGRAVTSGLFR